MIGHNALRTLPRKRLLELEVETWKLWQRTFDEDSTSAEQTEAWSMYRRVADALDYHYS